MRRVVNIVVHFVTLNDILNRIDDKLKEHANHNDENFKLMAGDGRENDLGVLASS